MKAAETFVDCERFRNFGLLFYSLIFPSKKIIWTFVVCLLVVGGIFAFLEYKNRPVTVGVANRGLTAYSQSVVQTNGDWQKILQDVIQNVTSATSTDLNGIPKASGLYGGNTPTDQFSRELFTKYLTLAQNDSGNAGNYQNYQDIVSKYVDAAAKSQKTTIYAGSDFSTVTTETPTVIRRYGNDMGEMFFAAANARVENEVAIFQKATDNEDRNELKKLDENIAVYKEIVHALLTMRVPTSFVSLHVTLLNDVSTIISTLEGMKLVFDDPITSLGAVQKYPEAAGNFIPILQSIKTLLVDSKVNFQQGEAGYSFINAI